MSTPSNQARAIFLEAIEQHVPEKRAEFIALACGGDVDLRARVERLLRSHELLGTFHIDAPAGDVTLDQPGSKQLGQQIGPYKLLQEIGQGGMGIVYMAEQSEPVKRRVALKIIKPGMDTRQVIARFEAERQALTLMDHPNIARVLDAGATDSGLPYFAMELVKGISITHYCDEHHLTPRERLKLFIPICQAVQHAHQKGIIHRDLKPTNILVALYDDRPVPKVIDFGIAKATSQQLTEKTMFTQYGQIVGTLEYMSPEQANLNQLDIDTRSDIYSLGVLLYELLTGSTPVNKQRLRSAAYEEMMRIIREEEPPKPSTRLSAIDTLASVGVNRHMELKKLSTLMRGELDWIVMKALEKDRERRYETATSFASDVRRYLSDEPVEACPPSAIYRLRKFARRNKASLTTAVVVAGVLLLTVLAASGFGWMHLRQRAQTDRQVELALQEATIFQRETKWPEALAAVKRAEALSANRGGSGTLERRTRELQRDVDMASKLEGIQLQVMALDGRHFDLEQSNMEYQKAFRDYGIDLDALEPPHAAEVVRARSIRANLVAALDHWARLLTENHLAPLLTESTTNKETWRRLLLVARLADTDDWRNRIRLAVEQGDGETLKDIAREEQAKDLPASTLDLIANSLYLLGANQAALDLFRVAQRRHPGDYWINADMGRLISRIRPLDRDEAIRFYTAALAARAKSPEPYLDLGWQLMEKGLLDEAVATYREATRLGPTSAHAHNCLGAGLSRKGLLDEAIAAYREAIRLKPNLSSAYSNLGIVLSKKGLLDEAIATSQEAIRFKPDDSALHSNLGVCLATKGAIDEAISSYKTAIRLNKDNVAAHNNLAWILATCPNPKFRDPTQAVELATKADQLNPSDPGISNTLGVAQYGAGDWKAAITNLEKSVELSQGGNSYDWFFLAMAHWQMEQKEESRKWYDKAVVWMDKNKPKDEELLRFRVEAAELLNIKDESKSQEVPSPKPDGG